MLTLKQLIFRRFNQNVFLEILALSETGKDELF